MRPRARLATVALTAGTVVAAIAAPAATARPAEASSSCVLPEFGPGASYHPHIDPADFGPNVTNPWFPLAPGTTYVYTGRKDGAAATDVFAPSVETKVIDGVRTRVVHDRLLQDGILVERTADYYAQDRCGNVWYFGEDTAELNRHGRVISREGSFHAGVDGAEPGVYMQADPTLGRAFRQEWAPGNAEDQFVAVAKHAVVQVPYGRFRDVLRTEETTALEPGVLDNKLYARGIGQLVEVTLRGGDEKLTLVDVLN